MGDLADKLGTEERDNVEWKRDAKSRDLLSKAICALANDLPDRGQGHLVIGVQNDGSPTGLTVDDDQLLRITNIRDEGRILPRPVISVSKASFSGMACVYVVVEPSRSRITRFDGVVWVRVGPSTRRATREEEVILTERSSAGHLLFDQHPLRDTSVRDLDIELFRSAYLPAAVDPDVLADNGRSTDQQLASLGMLDATTGEARTLGLLIAGLDPSAVIPGAYLQFVRYEGVDEASNVVSQEELRGNLVSQMAMVDRLLKATSERQCGKRGAASGESA